MVISITKTNQGGAVNGDYRGVPSSVTFNSGGDREQTFTVTARPDDDNDDGESVKLTFGTLPEAVTASGATETTISIEDDDYPVVTVSFKKSTYRVAEGGSSTTPDVENEVTVTVTLSGDPERTVTIPLTNGGSATRQGEAGADYSGVPPSVTFNAGDTEKSFTITAVNDTVDDDDESIALSFGNLPTGVLRGDGTTVTIEDDDVPDVVVSFGADAYDVDEGESVEVTVELNKDPERQVVIPITRSNQGASDQDYSGVPTTTGVTFESGDTTKVINFSATQDSGDDDGESVVIGFDSSASTWPSQVATGTPSSTTVRIGDDDNPTVEVNFEQTEYSVDEGAEVTVTVTLERRPRAVRHDPD